jgi:hypothetical protein
LLSSGDGTQWTAATRTKPPFADAEELPRFSPLKWDVLEIETAAHRREKPVRRGRAGFYNFPMRMRGCLPQVRNGAKAAK